MNIRDDTKKVWGEIWASQNIEKLFEGWVERETKSVRFRKIQVYIGKHHRFFSGLKVIELGAGTGVYSLLFARLGADVTVLDVNQNVLDKAKAVFEKKGIFAKFIRKDAFGLGREFLDRFDIVMSFGFVEHFRYPQRYNIIKAHYGLLKSGGILIISVPNLLFFPHEIMKMILRIRGKWYLGYERSFSSIELKKVAKKLQLKNWKIVGSSFIYDFKKYVNLYRTSTIGQRLFGLKQREHTAGNSLEKKSIFDDFLGADIVLLGVK